MARLPRVDNTLNSDPMPGAVYSAQSCTRSTTTLTCAMLAQNTSHPAASRVHLHNFPLSQPGDGAMSTNKRHARRAQCTSCARANLTQVLTRLSCVKSSESYRGIKTNMCIYGKRDAHFRNESPIFRRRVATYYVRTYSNKSNIGGNKSKICGNCCAITGTAKKN